MPMTQGSRRLVLLCATGVFVAMTQAAVVPYVALHAGATGAPPAAIGLVVALGFLVPLTIAVRTGRIVDRFGPRVLLVVGSGLLVAAPVPVTVAPGPATIVLLTVLVNLGHVACVVASQRAVARTVASRESAYGWFTTFVSLGQLLGPIALGQAIDSRGLPAGLTSIEVSALAALALAVVTSRGMPREAGRPPHGHPSIREELRTNRAFLISVAGSGAVLFVLGVHQTFYPVALDAMGVSATAIGLVLGVRAVAAVLVRPLLVRAVRWTGSRATVYSASLLCCGLGIAMPVFGAPLLVATLGSILVGIGSGLAQPMSMVVLADHVHRERHGTLLGTRMAVNYAGFGLASIVVGAAIALVGYTSAFLASALLPASIAYTVARRRSVVDVVPDPPPEPEEPHPPGPVPARTRSGDRSRPSP